MSFILKYISGIAISTFVLLIVSQVSAKADEKPKPKINIAIMRFKAHNASSSLGLAVTDMMNGKLFHSNLFVLYERSQMEIIAARRGFDESSCDTPECAAKFGSMLSVEKMVTGSISAIDGEYRIEIRVVNVVTGTVELAETIQGIRESKIEHAIDESVHRFEDHYLNRHAITERYDLIAEGSVLFPMGDLAMGVDVGYGGNLRIVFNELNRTAFTLMILAGFYSFKPKLLSIQYMYMIPLDIFAGYRFIINKNINLTPLIGAGYIFTIMNFDRVEERTTGYVYRVEFFYNPAVSIKLQFDIALARRVFLTLTPGYKIFFESKKPGHLITADLGFRILF